LRLKDFRQAAKAIPGVIANLRFPIDNNLTLAVAILSLHAWALAFFIFGGNSFSIVNHRFTYVVKF
jgi:hypothetical protein